MEPLILSFDIGTQSIRALLIDKKGNIVKIEQLKYDSPCLEPKVFGQAEQKPDFYYDNICTVSASLKEHCAGTDLFDHIKGVTITCMRDTVLLLDKDHKPLRNIILWMDARRASSSPELGFFKKILLTLVGMKESVDMLYKDAFFNWIRDNEPELYEKADKFVLLPGYVSYKMTGNLCDSVANQVGHIPFDNKQRKWMDKGLSRCVADVPSSMLIDIVETGNAVGYINKETAEKSGIPEGLPLIATGTDKACEALGLGVIDEDKCAISLGTAAVTQFCTRKYFEPEPFLPSYPSILPGYFNSENQIYRGYWIVTWFKNQFCQDEIAKAKELGIKPEEILDGYLNDIPAGCNGLIMTPHLAPGAGNPFAKGIITGLNDRHTKKHLYKAIIEGIDFEMLLAKNRMEKRSGLKIKEVYAAGGGSVNDAILQITADIFGLPVKRIQTHEATGIGSAITAFVGLGEFSSYRDAVNSMVHDGDVFLPDIETHEIYDRIYNEVYKHLEKRNTKLFKKIRK